jgi:hypothetical protein
VHFPRYNAVADFQPVRKKPVIVHAAQIHQDFTVETMEGTMKGKAGDYLMRGVDGERYPCDQEIYRKSYESATESAN